MDWKAFWTCALMLVASCSGRAAWDEGKPGTILIGRIERELEGRPCIGALDQWERHYAFDGGPPDSPVDRNVIFFSYRQAGVEGFRPQRRIQYLEDLFYLGRARSVLGEYHVASGRLFVHACGRLSHVPMQSIFHSLRAAAETP